MRPDQKGFTLVELTMVIIVLSVISVVAIQRFSGEDLRDRADHDQLLSAIATSQSKSMISRCPIALNIDGNGWRAMMAKDCSADPICLTKPLLVSGQAVAHDAPTASSAQRLLLWRQKIYDIAANGCLSRASIGKPMSANSRIALGSMSILIDGATGYVRKQ